MQSNSQLEVKRIFAKRHENTNFEIIALDEERDGDGDLPETTICMKYFKKVFGRIPRRGELMEITFTSKIREREKK